MTKLTHEERWIRRLEKEVLEVKRSRDNLIQELRDEKQRTMLLENKFRAIAREIHQPEIDVPRLQKVLNHGLVKDDD